MLSPAEKIVRFAALRRAWAEPVARATDLPRAHWAEGLPVFDTWGGLPTAQLTELIAPTEVATGAQTLLTATLAAVGRGQAFAALVDPADSFDPASAEGPLGHLLWVRPPSPTVALQAADTLLRDSNFSLVILDFRTPLMDGHLRRTPPALWYRWQRVVVESGVTVICLTARPQVVSARLRLRLNPWKKDLCELVADWSRPRSQWAAAMLLAEALRAPSLTPAAALAGALSA